MIKDIIIVGAGGFGREISHWLEDIALKDSTIRIAGFLDDTIPISQDLSFAYPYPTLGKIDEYEFSENEFVVIGVGDPSAKLKIAKQLQSRGAKFYNLIHPSSIIARTAILGQGLVICPFSLVSASCRIEDFVTINTLTSVGHDTVIGEGTTISSHVDITGFVKLGSGVFVGSSASILPKVTVGSFSTIGASSLVVRNVAESTTVYTLPGKKL